MLKAILLIIFCPLAALYRWAADPPSDTAEDDAEHSSTDAVLPAAKVSTHTTATSGTSTVRTTLSFVAHEDDDLLFMNPDIAADVQAGDNVWVVYMTAGEVPPRNLDYANRRVAGELAAYARAAHVANRWKTQPMYFAGHELTTSALEGTRVRLVFTYIHAADSAHGEPYGDLWRMRQDETFEAVPLDGRATYTHDEFVDMLREIIYTANPDLIRTQNSQFEPNDHVDHTCGAILAAEADTIDGATMVERTEYHDYQIGQLKDNWTGYWVTEKAAIWHTYMRYDPEVAPGAWEEVMKRQHVRATYMPGDEWYVPDDF